MKIISILGIFLFILVIGSLIVGLSSGKWINDQCQWVCRQWAEMTADSIKIGDPVIALFDDYGRNSDGTIITNNDSISSPASICRSGSFPIKEGTYWLVSDIERFNDFQSSYKLQPFDPNDDPGRAIYGRTETFKKASKRDMKMYTLSQKKKKPVETSASINASTLKTPFPDSAYFNGNPYLLGKCQVNKTSDGYQINVPAGPYLVSNTGIAITKGEKVFFTVTGNVNGSVNPHDGANKTVGADGWNNYPCFLTNRPLLCPQANFMAAIGHIMDKAGNVITSFPLQNEVTITADGILIIGSNEPLLNYLGKYYNAAKDNGGEYTIKTTTTSAIT